MEDIDRALSLKGLRSTEIIEADDDRGNKVLFIHCVPTGKVRCTACGSMSVHVDSHSVRTVQDLGLHDLYDDYFAWVYNQRMKPYCEWAGISCNPDSLHFELFESHIPVHHAGFLFNPVGHKANFGMTHVVLEDSTGFVYSNDQMICIESMYARGIDPDDIEDLSLFGRRYLENLQYLQEGVFESFKEIMNKDFNRLVSGIPK